MLVCMVQSICQSQLGDETVPDRIKVFLKTQVPIIYFHVAKLYTLSIMTNTCIVIHKWPSTAMSILEHNFQHQYGLDDVSDRQTSYIVHWYWQQCQISSDLQGCPKAWEGKYGFPSNHSEHSSMVHLVFFRRVSQSLWCHISRVLFCHFW